MGSVCANEIHVTVENIKILFLENVSWRISFAGKDKKHWILHVKCPIFCSDFIRVCSSPLDFHKSLQHQISWNSVQLELT